MKVTRETTRRCFNCHVPRIIANASASLATTQSILSVPQDTQRRRRRSCFYSSSSKNNDNDEDRSRALNYLQTWAGLNSKAKDPNTSNSATGAPIGNNYTPTSQQNSQPRQQQQQQQQQRQNPLIITGSSYLLPTLRPDRSETPQSLSSKLESLFDKDSTGTLNRYDSVAVRAMLRPSDRQRHRNRRRSEEKQTWCVPIILDLGGYQPDGSPHYQPPPPDTLRGIVSVLAEWGVVVLGVTNVPIVGRRSGKGGTLDLFCSVGGGSGGASLLNGSDGGGSGVLALDHEGDGGGDGSGTMEREVVELGLPVLMARAGRTLGVVSSSSSSSPSSGNVRVEDLIQLVVTKVKEESDEIASASFYDDEEEEEEMADEVMDDSDMDDSDMAQQVNRMSFRELQKKCKERNLGAMGSIETLKERLLESYGNDHSDFHSRDSTSSVSVDKNKIQNELDGDDSDGYRDFYGSTDTVIDDIRKEQQKAVHPPEIEGSITTITSSTNTDNDPENHSQHQPYPTPTPTQLPPPGTKVYTGSVRSGQQISTDEPNQSLIIIGSVNSGGEVMADGDLYVFGRLRGRALAGLAYSSSTATTNSNTNNIPHGQGACQYRIFASNFDPELICIGDTFTTVDNVQDLGLMEGGGSCMVSVDDQSGELKFEAISL